MKTKHWILVFAGFALVLLAILWLRPKQSGLVGIYRDGKLIETVDLTRRTGRSRWTALRAARPPPYRTARSTWGRRNARSDLRGARAARPGGTPIVCLPNRLSIQWIERDAAVDAVSGGR